MSEKRYSWKYGNSFSAQMVGEQFEAIEKRDGTLTKAAIVDAARSEDSPMHGMFEWDDAVAGELYREEPGGLLHPHTGSQDRPGGQYQWQDRHHARVCECRAGGQDEAGGQGHVRKHKQGD